MTNRNIRKKHGYNWDDGEVHTGFGSRQTYGFTVDHLDTKTIEEAENLYEKIFVLTRTVLESNSSYCLDNDKERLQCCQDIADILRTHGVTSR